MGNHRIGSESSPENGLIREIRVKGAFDKRSADPSKNYGIHSVELWFILKGEKGAVQFVVYTGMYLPHVQDELWNRNKGDWNPFKPQGADIGFHTPVPQYEGQTPMDYECDLIPGGKCYYDGTSLGASEFLPKFLEGGDKAVWEMLEERYQELRS